MGIESFNSNANTLHKHVCYPSHMHMYVFILQAENQEQWDDSTLTKEEIEARMKRKFDAIVKRERAMAYAYSHQVHTFSLRLIPE